MSVKVTTLPTGMRVVTGHMPHLETVSLGMWIGAGARWGGRARTRHLTFTGTYGLQGHAGPYRNADSRRN